ncbi:MAG TPA: hypothetical protein VEK07_24190 [Polyangiaceae bacterium]|nr:hypothetical protein [Polyangiaceae bacterium]
MMIRLVVVGNRALASCGGLLLSFATLSAHAQQPEAPAAPEGGAPGSSSGTPAATAPDTSLDFSVQPPEGQTQDTRASSAQALAEPPPLRPRRKGLVLESTLGVLGFAGQFRHVAPEAYWLHGQLGYELFSWLMVFGSAEAGLTDTGESLDQSQSMAFTLWGFDGGLRATIHASDRVALYAQGEAGALGADVPHGSLAVLGFPHAETLSLALGGRLGAEWYQMDRHMALFVAGGGRYAQGFAKVIGPADLPLLWDAGAGIRYTF